MECAFTGAGIPSLQWPLGGKPSLLASGSIETRSAQTVDAAFPQLRRGFQRLEANLSLRHASSRCIGPGLRGLTERSMDGAAGNPPRSAPHESRSPPTANLRSGRFVRAQVRWVAAGVPWSEESPRSPNSHIKFIASSVEPNPNTVPYSVAGVECNEIHFEERST